MQTPLSYVCIHMDWTKDVIRLKQVEALLAKLKDRTHPVILAGDFNAQRHEASMKLLASAGWVITEKADAKHTFPADKPTIEIDYVVTRGLKAADITCTVIPESRASDHRPIQAHIPVPSESEEPIVRPDETEKDDMPAINVNVDASQVPDLANWVKNAADLIRQHDPAISKRLRVAGVTPPRTVNLVVDKDMKGVAGTSGTTIRLAAAWLRSHPDDWGMVIHEYTHVVQSYPKYDPPWLVEGIADYIRFFMFEPPEKRPRPNFKRANYDDGYRTTAAFLAWIEKTHAPNIIERLNGALRKTTYEEALFETLTGQNIESLWKEFSNATP